MKKDSTIWEEFPEDLEWRFIPGFEDYEINNYGDIISHKRDTPKYLNPSLSNTGHYNLSLCKNSRVYNFYVHQLVALTFIGPCPYGMEMAHKDGNPANNHISNLEYKTHRDNCLDKIIHGTHQVGEKNPASILNNEDVIQIRELYKLKNKRKDHLAVMFNVDVRTIDRIVRNERWTHI